MRRTCQGGLGGCAPLATSTAREGQAEGGERREDGRPPTAVAAPEACRVRPRTAAPRSPVCGPTATAVGARTREGRPSAKRDGRTTRGRAAANRRRGSGTPAEPPDRSSCPLARRSGQNGCAAPRGPPPLSGRYPAAVAGAGAGGAVPAAILRRAPPVGLRAFRVRTAERSPERPPRSKPWTQPRLSARYPAGVRGVGWNGYEGAAPLLRPLSAAVGAATEFAGRFTRMTTPTAAIDRFRVRRVRVRWVFGWPTWSVRVSRVTVLRHDFRFR